MVCIYLKGFLHAKYEKIMKNIAILQQNEKLAAKRKLKQNYDGMFVNFLS